MKLSEGKYQTATQVKVSSSETLFVGEVDSLLFLENNMRISADNLKKRGGRDDCMEVGLTHSRGVVGVTSYVSGNDGYSKGLATMRRGKGKHRPYTEKENL